MMAARALVLVQAVELVVHMQPLMLGITALLAPAAAEDLGMQDHVEETEAVIPEAPALQEQAEPLGQRQVLLIFRQFYLVQVEVLAPQGRAAAAEVLLA